MGCTLLFGIAWTAFASMFVFIGLSQEEWVFTILGTIFTLIGLGFIGWTSLSLYTRHKIGTPTLTIDPHPLSVGQPFTIHYEHLIKSDVEITQWSVSLEFKETATYQQGTDTRTVTHTTPVDQMQITGRHYREGEQILEAMTFEIPFDGMHTLDIYRNKLQWYVNYKVEIPRLADISAQQEIIVLPNFMPSEMMK